MRSPPRRILGCGKDCTDLTEVVFDDPLPDHQLKLTGAGNHALNSRDLSEAFPISESIIGQLKPKASYAVNKPSNVFCPAHSIDNRVGLF